MNSSRTAEEYIALAKTRSTADVERVCRELRDRSLTVLQTSGPASEPTNSIDLQAGTYVSSRFDCLVLISLSQFGNLCLVSHSLGTDALPRSLDLDGILSRAGWSQVPDDDITIILDEDTDADVMGTFFHMF